MNKILLLQIFGGIILLFEISGGLALPTNKVRTKRETDNDILSHMAKRSSEISGMFFIQHLPELLNIKEYFRNLGNKASETTKCYACKLGVSVIQHFINSGSSEDDIGEFAYKICTTFKIETPRVCTGVTNLFKRELTQVLAKVVLEPNQICSFVFQGCGTVVNPLHDWTIPLTPFPKPHVKPPRLPKPGSPTLRVLHISDVHIDPFYKENSSANCGEPLCCRATSGKPSHPEDAAGYWGDYRYCDVPLRTLEDMLSHINKTHQFDYVIWTGDIPPHDIWNYTKNEVIYLLHSASKVMYKYLGHVPIFPALGNHESSPVNSFPIPQIKGNDSISWLYEEVEKAWYPWIPGSSNTIKLGAYYSAEIYPGFKIISLNMNYCNNLNWWLLLNSTDPTGQLAWLVAQLQIAENKGEKVHIIGHIPPGEPDCLGVWSKNYNKIINRYENTVTAQFFGHTHSDEFEIFYDKSGPKPRATSIAYIGPSVTTYDGFNPGYRIYTLDGNYPESSKYVLDHETYFTNLTEANLKRKINWELEYSAKKAYNMSSLFPEDWNLLTERFEKDDSLFEKFHKYFYKMATYIPECDDICKKIYLCKMRRGQSNDPLIC